MDFIARKICNIEPLCDSRQLDNIAFVCTAAAETAAKRSRWYR
jgi:hypothetical protein